MTRKEINLRHTEEVKELLEFLYGNEDVKNEDKTPDSKRESGAKSAGEVVELSPDSR